jgi:hypothetical protein
MHFHRQHFEESKLVLRGETLQQRDDRKDSWNPHWRAANVGEAKQVRQKDENKDDREIENAVRES